jgi:hypothetical protein
MGLPPLSRLTLVLLVGVGHLLGVDDRDLAADSVLTEDEVEKLIIHAWRHGRVQPDLVAWLVPALTSARWAANRYESLDATPLGVWIASSTFSSRFTQLSSAWASPPDYNERLTCAAESAPDYRSLDELYLWIVTTCFEDDVYSWFTPLEFRLLGPDPERDKARERLIDARSGLQVTLAMPKSWPSHQHATTPPWFRDKVTTEGARFWRSSCGYIATLSVVVETDRDERSIHRWSYAPGMAVNFPDDASVELFIVLDPEDDPGYAPFYFRHGDYFSSQTLETMLTVGLVRIEFYRLQEDGQLRHLWNFGVPFLSDKIREHRDRWAGRRNLDLVASPSELLQMIDQRQRALFESTLPSLDDRSAAPSVIAARQWQLQILDDAARSHASGRIVDERLLNESASALRLAEATVKRDISVPDEGCVRPGEALFQISITEDAGWFSSAIVYRDLSGELRGTPLPLDSVNLNTLAANTPPRDALLTLLDPLREVMAEGIQDLVISAGLGTYALPIHDAALRLGFRTAVYCHSIRRMHESLGLPAVGKTLVLGHPGDQDQYLAAADAELNVVAALTQGSRAATGWRGAWPAIVHVAGHGIAGRREHEAGILLANDDFLSAPAILRDVVAEGTQVAFLSACSSGTGRFDIGRAAHAVPLDVALLEKGCHAVISTSAPVNDHVALVFASVFHQTLSEGGNAWESYTAARAAFSAGELRVRRDLREILDAKYPAWRTTLPHDAFEQWTLFRYSGDRQA